MARTNRYTIEQVIDAIRETKGMVYLAAERLGCEARTIYNYRDRYASVRAEMEQQDGIINDAAEMKLYKAIMDGESWAIQFRLRTKAKDRGYTERQEITGADGGAMHVKITYANDNGSPPAPAGMATGSDTDGE